MTQANDLILEAAGIISMYDKKLSEIFINQPFRRVNIAYAFSGGFAKSPNDDITNIASLVIRIALLDRELAIHNNS